MSSVDLSESLDGRVVLVTGAARGQGRQIAEHAVRAGAKVIAGDILDGVGELSAARPNEIHADLLDITDAGSWRRLIEDGIERFGKIDGLVNNAGVLHRAPLESDTAEDFERVWRINCLGAFLGIQATLPYLRVADGAAVVNTLSTAALTAWTGHGAYVSSKWALRGLTKVAALELAEHGVRVNAIVPGPVLTPMVIDEEDPAVAQRLANTPLGRAGLPKDIAELALFLLSDRAAFITGAEIVIDGGQTAGFVLSDKS